MNKCESAKLQIKQFNPLVNVITYSHNLSSTNAIQIFQNYDVILDATDNPATRYLINDTAIYLNKPLVLVLQLAGKVKQLFMMLISIMSILSYAWINRIIEALQAIKIIIGQQNLSQKMILLDGLRDIYKVVKLRGQQKDCIACQKLININEYDYLGFAQIICSSSVPYREGYKEIKWNIFYRFKETIKLFCYIQDQVHNTILSNWMDSYLQIDLFSIEENKDKEIYIMCRRGNNSRLACEFLKDKIHNIYNMIDGIDLNAKLYDPKIPLV